MGMITVVQEGRRQVVTDTFGRPFMDVPVAERRRCITGHHLRHVIEGIVRGITAKEIRHYYGGSGAATTEHMMLLPRLPQNWLFTVREQYTVLGYTVHEICHQLYTEFGIMERIFPGLDEPGFKPTNPQKHLKAFWNAVEDYRIEKICRTLFPGFPNYIDVTRDHSARKFLERVDNGEYTAANLSNPFFLGAVAVTWNGAELNRYRTQVPSLALDAINPKLRDWVMSWSADLAQVSIVMDSLDLAQRMVDDLYRQMADRSDPQATPESDEAEQHDPQKDDDQQPDQQDDDQPGDDQQDDDQQGEARQGDDQQGEDPQDDQQDQTASEDGNDSDAETRAPDTTSADDDRAGDASAGPDDDHAGQETADDRDRSAADAPAQGEDDGAQEGDDDRQDMADGDATGTRAGEDHVDDEDDADGDARDDVGNEPVPETEDDGDDQDDGKQDQATPGNDAEADAEDGTEPCPDGSGETGDEIAERGKEDDGDQAAGEDGSDDSDQQGDPSASDDERTGPDTGQHDDGIADDAASDGQDAPGTGKEPDTFSQGGTDTPPAADDAQDAEKGNASDEGPTDEAEVSPTPPQGGASAGGQQGPTSSDDDESGDGQADAGGGGAGVPDGTFQPEEPEDLSQRDLELDDGDGDEGQQKPRRPSLDIDENDDEGDPEAADLDIDDIRKALEKVEDPEAEDPSSVAPEDIGQSQDPEEESDAARNLRRDAVTKAGAERYAMLRASLGGPAMRSAGIVRRMLQSRSTTRIARGREEGDLDFERVVGMALGDSSIYRQMTRKIQVNTAISLLLDNSYSMDGHALAVCQQTAIVLDQSVTGTRTAIEITGFTSEFLTGKVRLYQYRTFEQKGNAAAASLGNMTKVQKGGTPVAVPIYDAVRRLTPRPEERKLMIVVSDGEAEDPSESADACAIAESMGITVVGISIGSPHNLVAMRQWCRIAHGIADIEELPQALTQIVQEILR